MTAQELQSKIKSASDKMRADDNTKNALAYLEQLTWLLFLKQWDAIEDDRELIAAVDKKAYERVMGGDYRWSQWTTAKNDKGQQRTGDDLIAFVSHDLLPHIRSLSGSAQAEQIAHLFASVKTVMKSGYSLAEVIAIVDSIDFHSVGDHRWRADVRCGSP